MDEARFPMSFVQSGAVVTKAKKNSGGPSKPAGDSRRAASIVQRDGVAQRPPQQRAFRWRQRPVRRFRHALGA